MLCVGTQSKFLPTDCGHQVIDAVHTLSNLPWLGSVDSAQ